MTASALVATIVFAVVNNGETPRPLPTPKDGGFPELVGVEPAAAGCKAVEKPRYQGHVPVQPGQS
ncbi:MAG: hypothetical protein ACRDJM_05335, partial [Actinomycetota bacterium]